MKDCDIIGKEVKVTVDRPEGSAHPKHKDMIYTVNYGYIEGIPGGDGEWQDAYIIGVDGTLYEFYGVVSARIKRRNDCEEKWVVVPKGYNVTEAEIREKTHFCEQYFDIEILL